MKENGTKKREWIKNVAIVFLIIMLVLTFFSNTILNYSLPEVAAQYCESGTITAKIRGNGIVESSDPYTVKIKQVKKVASVDVKSGDFVQEGTVLCTLSGEDSQELENAKAELEAAQDQLQSAENAYLLNLLTSDYDDYVLSGAGKLSSTETYLAQVNAAKAAVANAQKELEDQQKKVNDWKQKITNIDNQIMLTPNNSADTSAEAAAAAAAKTNASNAGYALTEAQNNLDAITREIQQRLDHTPEGEEPDLGNLLELKREAEQSVNTAMTNKNNAELELIRANDALANKAATGDTTGTIANLQVQKAQCQVELDKEQTVLEKKQENLQINSDNYAKLTKDIAASFGLHDMQKNVDNAKLAVKRAQKKVEDLSEQSAGIEVKAPISGKIMDIFVKSGLDSPDDGVVFTMQPEGKGYTMNMTITNEQARRLSVGDKADLVNSWRYDNMEIVISAIKPDKTNPGKNKVITFDVTGDNVVAGQSISVSVGQKSSNYDIIVPNSAIREDSNGKFVLIVESKSSPIGTRYYASRVDVEVLASDDTKSAITGALYGYEFVITTSTKPVEKGKQVRLAD